VVLLMSRLRQGPAPERGKIHCVTVRCEIKSDGMDD
jgi:hypothetical protein